MKRTPDDAYGDCGFQHGGVELAAVSVGGWGSPPKPEVTLVALKECIKSIHKSGERGAVLSTFFREIRVLGMLKRCPDVVHLFGVAFSSLTHSDEVKPTLILELAVEHLVGFFKSPPPDLKSVDWTMRSQFALDVCNGLKAVHQVGITHADIKGENILVFWDERRKGYRAKLSDFGHSRPTTSTLAQVGGTPRYLPPECLLGSHPLPNQINDVRRDTYALGLLVWGIATAFARQPFHDFDDEELRRVIIMMSEDMNGTAAQYHRLTDDTPPSFRQVLRETLWSDPQKRADVATIASLLELDAEARKLLVELEESRLDASTKHDPKKPNNARESLLKVPQALQEHLLREFRESSSSTVSDLGAANPKSLGYLAYCHVLMDDSNEGARKERDMAIPFLRAAALRHPFEPIGNSKLTPFRLLMELHDWRGLAEVFQSGDAPSVEFDQFCLNHVYSFGWQKLLVYLCMAGFDAATNVETLRNASQIVATNILKLLVSSESCPPNPGAASFDSVTAFHASILTGKIEAATELLGKGADVEMKESSQGRTALHLCCQSKNLSDDQSTGLARAILDKSPKAVNAVALSAFEYTPLRFALEAGKYSLFSFLVERGADVNARARHGSTVLQQCVAMGDSFAPFAGILLESKSLDINAQTGWGPWTALGVAFNARNRAMVELLLDHGADPDVFYCGEPLIHNVAFHKDRDTKGDCPFLGLLLRAGGSTRHLVQDPRRKQKKQSKPKPSNTAPFPQSVVHCAAGHTALPSLRQILQHDPGLYEWAHPIISSRPLHFAIKFSVSSSDKEVYAMVDFLVDLVNQSPTFSVDEADEDGNTPLHIASMYGMDFVIPRLITGGCSTSATNSNGKDPLGLYTECLKECGIEPSEEILQALYPGHHSWDVPSNIMEDLEMHPSPTQELIGPNSMDVEDGPKAAEIYLPDQEDDQAALLARQLDEERVSHEISEQPHVNEHATVEDAESAPEISAQDLLAADSSAFRSVAAWFARLLRGVAGYLASALHRLFRRR
ncbi:hypothetical protein BKA70DRAFT_1274696 [Coprinopsis sp. MPI-PUGE-AT-0042]|nr:hypothetical protein BKA70DRAFT_1274696 [Coprinopsis sp. MPI-PUGE-AT-0042]